MSKSKATVREENQSKQQAAVDKTAMNETEEAVIQAAETEPSDNELKTMISNLSDKVEELLCLFKEKIQKDETKDSLFEMLNSKLSKYEQDFIFEHIKKRLFSDLILLFDRVENLIRATKEGKIDLQRFEAALDSFCKEILQILKRQGVKLIQTECDKFNEEYQEAIDTKRVDSREKDQDIIEVVRKGFLYDNKLLLRPEEVIVAKYEPKTEGGTNHG